ncbi:hypothetical protein QPK32_13630 [Massilia sp. YIM B02763]|uniref:hypothetical protein n=1 Tax=Massilia sp. YIM B02763 TaxID=3050130 RepID=UPI0025B71F2D|nr:hypothetical protein [Massilia sp. YIM B02763]MDN4054121.1 hypothetical protein [Massilia sp. YIM B02763]
MKSSILRAGVTLACALGLAACGGGDGDLYLSGAVYNVTKDGLVLQNNGGETVKVTAPYTSFSFPSRVSTDDRFNITVKDKPSNASECTVTNPTARANYYTIAQISVSCTIKTHEFSVTVNGLTTSGLTIVNGSDRRDVAAGTSTVKMSAVYEDGPYGVTILSQPAGQTCTVTGGDNGKGSGTMGSTNLDGKVVINCA